MTILKNSRYDNRKLEIPVIYLARLVHKHDAEKPVSRSQYKSVCRAVKSLEQKNYVKTEFRNERDEFIKANRYKVVMIGPRMYEEEQWLAYYKRFDIKNKNEGLPEWYKKSKT